MKVEKIDPVDGQVVTDIYAPFVIKAVEPEPVKIYFSSYENKQIYLYVETLEQYL